MACSVAERFLGQPVLRQERLPDLVELAARQAMMPCRLLVLQVQLQLRGLALPGPRVCWWALVFLQPSFSSWAHVFWRVWEPVHLLEAQINQVEMEVALPRVRSRTPKLGFSAGVVGSAGRVDGEKIAMCWNVRNW